MTLDPIRADTVKTAHVDWLWEGRMPRGMFSLVAGRPGTAKSLLTSYLAARVSLKEKVLVANAEDDIASVQRPRLEAAGANLKNISFIAPRFPQDLKEIEELIVKMKVGLVIIDPVASHFSVNLYNDNDCRPTLQALTNMLSRTGATMIGVHHIIKHASGRMHPLAAIGGSSSGLVGNAREVFIFGENPKDSDERLLADAKWNVREKKKVMAFDFDVVELDDADGNTHEVPRLTLSGETSGDAQSVLDFTGNDKTPAKRAVAAEWLTKYLSLGSAKADKVKDDAAKASISIATLRRAAEEVGVIKITAAKGGFGKGTVSTWSLPPGHPALLPAVPPPNLASGTDSTDFDFDSAEEDFGDVDNLDV